jgi:hypothetical protein
VLLGEPENVFTNHHPFASIGENPWMDIFDR